jgi:hypothetical protein
MCSIHNKVVDDDEATYTVDCLRKMKADHEAESILAQEEDVRVAVALLVAGDGIATAQARDIRVTATNPQNSVVAGVYQNIVHNYGAASGAQIEPPKSPCFGFVFGSPLGDNNSANWMMMLKHYGPGPAHNCTVDFYDKDRINIRNEWLLKHPDSPFPPPDLVGEFRQQIRISEAGPEGPLPMFNWTPLNPDLQHYSASISSRDGVFVENWEVTRVNGCLRSKITIERGPQWIEKNPNSDPVIFKLEDPEFVSAPLATEVPKASPVKVVHPGWKPNHRFDVPAAILDPNGNLQIMSGIKLPDGSTLTDFGSWNILTRHFGHNPSEAAALPQKLEHLEVRGPIEQTWNAGNSTAYWLEVTNKSTAKTIRNVRAEVVKIEPLQTHLNWPVPLVVKHSQGKPVRDSTSLNAGQPGGFDLVSAHRGGPISVLHTVPDINSTLHQGSLFRLTVKVTGEDASPVTKQFDVWQDVEGFLRCTPA